jgi:hypothetical protein
VRWLFVGLLAWGGVAQAVEVMFQEVKHRNGQYTIELELLLAVPADYIERALLDFNRLPELNPAITQVETMASPKPDTTRVRTHIHTCFWFRCIDLEHVEDVSRLQPGLIQAVTIRELSDFETGFSQWEIRPLDEQTYIHFTSGFDPRQDEIPLVGPMIAKYVIREEAMQTYENIEQRYRNEILNVRPR